MDLMHVSLFLVLLFKKEQVTLAMIQLLGDMHVVQMKWVWI